MIKYVKMQRVLIVLTHLSTDNLSQPSRPVKSRYLLGLVNIAKLLFTFSLPLVPFAIRMKNTENALDLCLYYEYYS